MWDTGAELQFCVTTQDAGGRVERTQLSHVSLWNTFGLGWTKGWVVSMILYAENDTPCLYVYAYGVLRVHIRLLFQ